MKKRNLAIISGALTAVFLFGMFGCSSEPQLGGKENWSGKSDWMTKADVLPTSELTLPTKNYDHGSGIAVHDPSVYYDDITGIYYSFGTHFAVAKSRDLIKWEQVANDNQTRVLYGNADWKTVLADSITQLGGTSAGSTWAPDVLRIGDKYYMYYSLTKDFGSSCSVIGRVSADDVLGPYSNNEVLLYSPAKTPGPNCIDPELFYDKEGRLWMVFGSFFGGIYVKELQATGPNAGLPLEGENGLDDYGKLVWNRGFRSGVEGPFAFYNAELDYYYLMVSEGDLQKDYTMRIARSKTPVGPYLDISGDDVATREGTGNKVAGNYKFAGEMQGFGALGHNSVIKRDGKYFVVYHTRYQQGAGVSLGHNLMVNQLYFNEQGWPVMSPNRYIGEEKGTVTVEKVASDYDVVLFETATTDSFKSSVKYTLKTDGTIADAAGENAGTWSISQNYYVKLTINSVEYNGVFCTGWRSTDAGQRGVISITATNNVGTPLWAQQVIG